MPAKVKLPEGEEIEVEVEYTKTTIDDVKRIIEKDYSYPVGSQILSFDGKVLEDGSKTLEDVQYVKERSLSLTLKSILRIIRDGSAPITSEFKKLEDIADLRKRIAAALSITPEKLKLTFEGAIVEDQEGYTVEDKGIVEGSEIHADELPEGIINTTVRTLTGKFIELKLATSQTGADVKESLTKVIGLKRDNMRLLHKGRQLEDTKTLAAAGIIDGSFIYLVTRLTGGS